MALTLLCSRLTEALPPTPPTQVPGGHRHIGEERRSEVPARDVLQREPHQRREAESRVRLVLGYWDKLMRDADCNTERRKRRRAHTQDPSTDLAVLRRGLRRKPLQQYDASDANKCVARAPRERSVSKHTRLQRLLITALSYVTRYDSKPCS